MKRTLFLTVLTVILTFSGQHVWGQIISGNQPLVFETNGVEAMRIDVAGNVGIGTTSPSVNLHIHSPLFTDVQPLLNLSSQAGIIETGGVALSFLHGSVQPTYRIYSRVDNFSTGRSLLFASGNNAGGYDDRVIFDNDGNVGIGMTSPNNPLHMASGAHVTAGGVWTDASSRQYKENIRDLTVEEAMTALRELQPSRFNYKVDKEEEHVGFIAEDVPELLANKDRNGLSPMDIVAVLTKVVQEQQKRIEALEGRLNAGQ